MHLIRSVDDRCGTLPALALVELCVIIPYMLCKGIKNCYYYPENPTYVNFIPYTLLTTTLDVAHRLKNTLFFLALHTSTLTKTQKIALIEKKLHTIKQTMLDKEDKIIQNISQAVNLNAKSFNATVSSTKQLKQDNIIHDENVDTFTLFWTKKLLLEQGLDPQQYILKLKAQFKNNHTAYHKCFYMVSDDQTELYCYKQKIYFNKKVYSHLTEKQKLAVIAHEVAHASLKHLHKQYLIKYHLSNQEKPLCTDISSFTTLCEQQAEIFPSISNPLISHCMRIDRSYGYYPGHLYLSHYNALCAIDELHTLRKWIEKSTSCKSTYVKKTYATPLLIGTTEE